MREEECTREPPERPLTSSETRKKRFAAKTEQLGKEADEVNKKAFDALRAQFDEYLREHARGLLKITSSRKTSSKKGGARWSKKRTLKRRVRN